MFRELLRREMDPYQKLTEAQIDQLYAHHQLLSGWNQRLNLTRIESLEEAVRFHYCEPLYLGSRLPNVPLTVADVGSGAGFPGVPIAILRPECRVTLLESHQRKSVFLREATRDLPNCLVRAIRAEDCEEKFDWIVSRAVDPSEVRRLGIAPRMALLVGVEDADALGAGFTQEKLPWGLNRVLAIQ
jgi:16S rRNA (guanine527-N7)-methyltransferase